MKKIVLLVLTSLMLLGNSLALAPGGTNQIQQTKRFYWCLGNLTLTNSNRTISNVTFSVKSRDFGVGTVPPNTTGYAADATIGVTMFVGPKPKPLTRIHWICHGENMEGSGQCFCIAIGRPFRWWTDLPFPSKGAIGRLSFGMGLNETEKSYRWTIEVWVGKLHIDTSNITYSFTLRRGK